MQTFDYTKVEGNRNFGGMQNSHPNKVYGRHV